jgi:hypothetical protein
MIDCDVVGDLEQPTRQLELGPVAIDVVQDLDEGVLGEILGNLAIPHHPEDQRENGALVSTDEFSIRGFLPLLSERDEVSIGEIAYVENWGHAGAKRRPWELVPSIRRCAS